jgi:hypothetical protein
MEDCAAGLEVEARKEQGSLAAGDVRHLRVLEKSFRDAGEGRRMAFANKILRLLTKAEKHGLWQGPRKRL